MKFLLISLLVLSFTSCREVYEVTQNGNTLRIHEIDNEINKISDVEWKVGRKRRNKKVSKGFRIRATAPNISDTGKAKLLKKHGIDSWILRVLRKRRGRESVLEYVRAPLSTISRNERRYTFSVYYQAAAVSKRFRLFHCPAFNHRFRLDQMDIIKNGQGPQSMYTQAYPRIETNINELRFSPQIIAGGRNLVGLYSIEMALFNSKTKQRFSKWLRLQKSVLIKNEIPVSMPNCEGIKEEINPLPESKFPSIEDLEIK